MYIEIEIDYDIMEISWKDFEVYSSVESPPELKNPEPLKKPEPLENLGDCYVCFVQKPNTRLAQFSCDRKDHNVCTACSKKIKTCPMCRGARAVTTRQFGIWLRKQRIDDIICLEKMQQALHLHINELKGTHKYKFACMQRLNSFFEKQMYSALLEYKDTPSHSFRLKELIAKGAQPTFLIKTQEGGRVSCRDETDFFSVDDRPDPILYRKTQNLFQKLRTNVLKRCTMYIQRYENDELAVEVYQKERNAYRIRFDNEAIIIN